MGYNCKSLLLLTQHVSCESVAALPGALLLCSGLHVHLVHTVLIVKGQNKKGHGANHTSTFKVLLRSDVHNFHSYPIGQSKSHSQAWSQWSEKAWQRQGNKILWTNIALSTVRIDGIMCVDQIIHLISHWGGKRNQRRKKENSIKVIREVKKRTKTISYNASFKRQESKRR